MADKRKGIPENLPDYKSRWKGAREPGRAAGIELAERYGDERTQRQLGANPRYFLSPTPSGRSAGRAAAKKKRTGRKTRR
jgi:hypothetical protein